MEWLILLGLWFFREKFLTLAQIFLFEKLHYGEELLFYYTYSMEKSVYEFTATKVLYRSYQLSISLVVSAALFRYFGLSPQMIFFFAFLFLLIIVAMLSSTMEKNKSRLVQDLSQFVFYYELYLIQGENQYHAMEKASQSLQVLGPAETVEEYLMNFHKLFSYTKWLVVKRIVILLEKGRHFTQRDMSMDFAQISDELFRRIYQDRKLRSEKLENLMLLPMVGDLLVMVLYIVSPFVGVMIGG